MANEQNLTQKGRRLSTEEAQRLAQRSVEVRRKKKELVKSAREFAIAALNAVTSDKETGEKYVVKDAIIRKLIVKAIQEIDLNAIKYLFELIGESPADYANMATDIPQGIKKGVDIDAWINREIEADDKE